ncbi:winged helix-turn-helix domain-containing protein [Amycolatopsis sp. PS_44_ISF1]|nr:BTAD domain-containing putative transcriptional regulator [Amycolatopsis sp. PS_44_ISF1]MDT8916045.1 winged helix-turn-helix domain-containing protein [Amycolatopsis sp. PS_44_ISF1]
MASGHRPVARVARLLGRAARGLVAALVLAALVAGLPWVLIYGVGWPLPGHVPSAGEIGAVLMAPMSPSFLLDTLACLAWLLWLVFAVDVAACVLDAARGARWPELRGRSGPVRRVAAVLVGALLLAVLGRTATAATAAPPVVARPVGHTPAVATALAWTMPASHKHTGSPPSQPSAEPGTERVRPPEAGVHDSLWRIAQRRLGDGDRWPEIWALNEGSAQPDGRVLSDPNRIHPGDTLRLPETPTPPVLAPSPQAPTAPAPETQAVPPPASTTTPAPSEPVPSPAPTQVRDVGTATGQPAGGAAMWGSGETFVGLGLAAAISALLMLARRRRQARYRPGSGRRDDDLPLAPAVYQLRLAHLRAQHHDEDTVLEAENDQEIADPAPPAGRSEHARSESSPRSTSGNPGKAGSETAGQVQVPTPRIHRVIGVPFSGTGPENVPSAVEIALGATASGADGETTNGVSTNGTPAGTESHIALDLARVHGLGLVGPGGYAAARALLLTILTTVPDGGPAPRVLVPAADLARLLGVPVPATALPDTVTVVADLDTAMDNLDPQNPASPLPAVLIAAPPLEPDQQARLQQLLDNGAQPDLTAVLLGQWRAGVTAYVTASGHISATSPGLGEPLRGTRAFTLPETATRDLLAFLHTTQPAGGAHSKLDAARRADGTATAPTPEPAAQPPEAARSHPENVGSGPEPLEITSGPPAPEPSSAGGHPRGEPHPPPPMPDTTPAVPAPLVLKVFGVPTLHWRPDPARAEAEPRDLSSELSSRPVELLLYLAVHPGGVSRDRIVDALWPDEPPRNPASVLRTVLSRIRRTLDTATRGTVGELVLAEHGQYQLDRTVVEVDYWGFADAVTARRGASTPERRADANEAVVAHYGGLLAEGVDSDWLVAAREATRRDALDAVAALARVRVGTDPDYTLDLLETARAFDPHNELLYRDIMRLQHTLGRHDAISRTLTLLRTRLTEIDATPTADTVDLAERLRARHTGLPIDDNVSRSTAP